MTAQGNDGVIMPGSVKKYMDTVLEDTVSYETS